MNIVNSVCYFSTGVGLLAVALVALFLDNIDRDVAKEFRGNREPFCSTFLATVTLLRDKKLLLLIPVTIYSGLQQSFLWGEYTKVKSYGESTLRGGAMGSTLRGGAMERVH